jgi:hypothetical protein
MERHEFNALFRAFAEAAGLQTPLRLLLLAWVESNWRQVSEMDLNQVKEFLALARSNIISDQVTKKAMTTYTKKRGEVDIPLVVIQRVNVYIQAALNQIVSDDLAVFQRLVETLGLSESGGDPSRRPR